MTQKKFGKIIFTKKPRKNYYDAIIISVSHMVFKKMGLNKILKYGKKNCKVFDIKNLFSNQKGIINL